MQLLPLWRRERPRRRRALATAVVQMVPHQEFSHPIPGERTVAPLGALVAQEGQADLQVLEASLELAAVFLELVVVEGFREAGEDEMAQEGTIRALSISI